MSTSRLAARAAALSALTLGGLATTVVAAPSALADPPGNNGTVKIAAEDDLDLIPDNEPHQGCAFTVQWYDFDKGDDIVSKVTFELQAPTDTEAHSMVVNGPGEVFVGEDEAEGGAGNDFDGEQVYTLAFTGEAAEQGYHVKLTVNTPGSKGADVKHKVFWVEGCEEPTEEPTPTDEPTPTEEPTPTDEPTEEPTPTDEPTVLGTETSTPIADPVPTLIDAGIGDDEPAGSNPAMGLALLAGGGALGAASILLVRAPRGRRQV